MPEGRLARDPLQVEHLARAALARVPVRWDDGLRVHVLAGAAGIGGLLVQPPMTLASGTVGRAAEFAGVTTLKDE